MGAKQEAKVAEQEAKAARQESKVAINPSDASDAAPPKNATPVFPCELCDNLHRNVSGICGACAAERGLALGQRAGALAKLGQLLFITALMRLPAPVASDSARS